MPNQRAPGKTRHNIDIPDGVYAAAGARAAAAGTTVSAVVNDALARYAAGDDAPDPAPTGPHVYQDFEWGQVEDATGQRRLRVVLVRRVYNRDRRRRDAVLLSETLLADWPFGEVANVGASLFALLGVDQPAG